MRRLLPRMAFAPLLLLLFCPNSNSQVSLRHYRSAVMPAHAQDAGNSKQSTHIFPLLRHSSSSTSSIDALPFPVLPHILYDGNSEETIHLRRPFAAITFDDEDEDSAWNSTLSGVLEEKYDMFRRFAQNRGLNDISWSVFPNPSSGGSVTLSDVPAGIRSVQLIDLRGRILLQVACGAVHNALLELELGQPEPGIYIIRLLEDSGKSTIRKLLIQQ